MRPASHRPAQQSSHGDYVLTFQVTVTRGRKVDLAILQKINDLLPQLVRVPFPELSEMTPDLLHSFEKLFRDDPSSVVLSESVRNYYETRLAAGVPITQQEPRGAEAPQA